ncbi:hypothetical protein J6590_092691 [Homalodisca vitripennis]|nr:hypothetical protein J6590_092691 [Homalodisca vitripennis]
MMESLKQVGGVDRDPVYSYCIQSWWRIVVRVTIHELRCPAKLRECPRWTEEIVPCPYNFSPWRRMLPPSPRNKPPRPQRPPPYPRDLEECWEEGCVDNSGRVLRRLWCDQHGPSTTPDDDGRRSYTATCTTTTNNTRTYTDILLVGFDASVLPPTINWFDSVGDVRQDYLDERRRRDACASRIETLRRSLPAGSNRTLQFIIAYGEEAKRRTVDTLRGMKCRFTEMPTFQTTGDFYDHTITDSSVRNDSNNAFTICIYCTFDVLRTRKRTRSEYQQHGKGGYGDVVRKRGKRGKRISGYHQLALFGIRGSRENSDQKSPNLCLGMYKLHRIHGFRWKTVGRNCSGGGGIISYDGHLYCECPPTIDSVTGTNRPTVRMDVNGTQLCVSNQDLYEVD